MNRGGLRKYHGLRSCCRCAGRSGTTIVTMLENLRSSQFPDHIQKHGGEIRSSDIGVVHNYGHGGSGWEPLRFMFISFQVNHFQSGNTIPPTVADAAAVSTIAAQVREETFVPPVVLAKSDLIDRLGVVVYPSIPVRASIVGSLDRVFRFLPEPCGAPV
jgi:hypothetical protein